MTEASELRWRKTDESDFLAYCPDHCDRFLFYARTYTARQGYEFSQTNQLIHNLKKPVTVPENQLRYKQEAIRRFAREVIKLLQDNLNPAHFLTIVPIPPSKAKSHPEYDNRIEQVGNLVAGGVSNASCLPMLSVTVSRESYHGGAQRNPDKLYELLQIDSTIASLYVSGSIIALLDDVLTSGSHFTAARRRILESFPGAEVIGIFWAKSVSLIDELEDI